MAPVRKGERGLKRLKTRFATRYAWSLRRSRNLCEELAEIDIFPSADYTPHANVDLKDGADPAEVLAKTYLACAKELAAGVLFLPFDRAVAQGTQPEEMLRGPFTPGGMIVADRGNPLRPHQFSSSELFSLITTVEGVESVKAFAPRIDMHGADDALLRLHWPKSQSEIAVNLFRNGRKIEVKLHDLNMAVEELNFAGRWAHIRP